MYQLEYQWITNNLHKLLDTIDKRCGYEGAREAFEVCALAVMKISTLESNNVNSDLNGREISKNVANKENKQQKWYKVGDKLRNASKYVVWIL